MRRIATLGAAVLAAAALLPAAGVLPVGTPGAATRASAAAGLTTTADARYVVDPDAHRVHVAVTLAATNHLADTKTHRYFFDRAFLAVPPSTSAFKITSSGASPRVAVTVRHSTYNLLRIDFGKQLAAGATRTFNLSFDIADTGGAATRATRIGTSLVTFTAWGLGTREATGGSVTVVFPTGFTVDVHAAGLGPGTPDVAGNTVFTTGHLANPLTFSASFAADRPSAFTETNLEVAVGSETVPITIRSWPDDPAWTKRVSGLLERGLPALSKAIGLPWTAAKPLVVQEAVSRNSTGFAGRYDPAAGTIEIAYYASSFVILHEAAHAWFDGRLLADRWATEGFSSYYAIEAARAIKEKGVAGDALTPALDKVRVALNAWDGPAADGSTTPLDDAEYAAALSVASATAKLAGPQGLAPIWQAIAEGRAPYQPIGPGVDLERTDGAPDWRGLLDLLADHGIDATGIWATWVVRPSDARLLADRDAARTEYAKLADRAATWRLPRVVRDALRVWQYGQATELFASANRALDDRDTVLAAAGSAGLAVPSTMETDFEGPRGFAAASAEADAEMAAISAYRDAAAARPGTPNPLQSIGLWNADPNSLLAAAATAFSAGDLRTTVADAAFAGAIWTSAPEVGRNRLLAVSASLAAVLVGSWLVFRWYRDRGSRRRAVRIDRHRRVADR